MLSAFVLNPTNHDRNSSFTMGASTRDRGRVKSTEELPSYMIALVGTCSAALRPPMHAPGLGIRHLLHCWRKPLLWLPQLPQSHGPEPWCPLGAGTGPYSVVSGPLTFPMGRCVEHQFHASRELQFLFWQCGHFHGLESGCCAVPTAAAHVRCSDPEAAPPFAQVASIGG